MQANAQTALSSGNFGQAKSLADQSRIAAQSAPERPFPLPGGPIVIMIIILVAVAAVILIIVAKKSLRHDNWGRHFNERNSTNHTRLFPEP